MSIPLTFQMSKKKKTKKEKRMDLAFKSLKEVYKKIPDTIGCMDHINKPKEEGGCGGWCCKLQCPQVLYVEFLRTWHHILSNWSLEEISDLIERCIRNYLSDIPMKGCVFWDTETKLCKQHETRPYNCYTYGIIPEEEFRPRYERLKKEYADRPDVTVYDQCNLIETVTSEPLTVKQTDKWWAELIDIEKSIGIKKQFINDESGGSYLTYHDHILLKICSDGVMGNLQLLRQHGTSFEKEQAVSGIMQSYCKNIKG